jgi:8-oxo-dGTP pyrophosphatase MutT (NUDIX family)
MDWKQIPSPFYRVSLKVYVFDDKKRLLMCKSPDGEWEPPGGGWEYDEAIEECLNRELVEELGVKLKSLGRVLAVYCGMNKRGFRAIKIAFEATLDSFDFEYQDMVTSKFVTKEELLTLNMSTDERGIKEQVAKIWSE